MPTTLKSSTITKPAIPGKTKKRTSIAADRLPPIHPGEMLREEFLAPMGLSANALALAIRVPATRVSEIVNERRGISADTALRFARYFGISADFWLNLQSRFDLEVARDELERTIRDSIQPAPIDRKTGELKLRATA